MKFRSIFLLILSLFSNPAIAQDTLDPELPDRLAIQDVDGKEIGSFTLEQLKTEFPQHVYQTQTHWKKETLSVFKGPFFEDILKRSGLSENSAVKVIAYDDYITTIALDDIRAHKPIIALEALDPGVSCAPDSCENSSKFRPIDLLEKGPTRVIWPYDSLYAAKPSAPGGYWVYTPVILRSEK